MSIIARRQTIAFKSALLPLLFFGSVLFSKPCRELLSALEKSRATAQSVGLHYVQNFQGEIERSNIGTKSKPKFVYLDSKGNEISDEKVLERIASLKIPPGYTNVRISSDPRSHIQGMGTDERGRKQYRFHAKWIEARAMEKYASMRSFGLALQKIREGYKDSLAGGELTKDRVVAAVIKLVDLSHMRVGGAKYAEENGTFGISSLKKAHVKVRGDRIHLTFTGKSNREQDVTVTDPELATVIKELMKLSGSGLFQFKGKKGPVSVSEKMVNERVKELAGNEFSIKDFRTWTGSVTAFQLLRGMKVPEDEKERTVLLRNVYEKVAGELGNTWDVARDNYIHPLIPEAFEAGELKGLSSSKKGNSLISSDEEAFLRFLESQED